jgi:hypothetical protein
MKRLILATALSAKTLGRLAVALVFGSLATSAIAESLGEHPAVIVAREWNSQGVDPNTFIVLHPAAPKFLAASASEKDKVEAGKHSAPQTP